MIGHRIRHELLNICMPMYCCLCRRYMPYRHPFCRFCLTCVPRIAPCKIRVTDRRDMIVAAASLYESPISHRILGKHHLDVAAFDELGWLTAYRCYGSIAATDIIVPITLHWRRYAQRGFDQAATLAQRISSECHVPYSLCLVRTRWSGSQFGKSALQRKHNVANSFALERTSPVYNRHVCLVDDVLSSGATLAQAAHTILHSGGARSVTGVVVARVV